MKKAKRERIKKLLERSLTVGKLKEKLAELPDDMPVGCVGWFGEFNTVSSSSVSVCKTYVEDRESGNIELEVFNFEAPDIGRCPE